MFSHWLLLVARVGVATILEEGVVQNIIEVSSAQAFSPLLGKALLSEMPTTSGYVSDGCLSSANLGTRRLACHRMILVLGVSVPDAQKSFAPLSLMNLGGKKMKTLRVKWQRLLISGETCSRCRTTEHELDEASFVLRQILDPLGIDVVLEKEELSFADFKKDPLRSNEIWLNDRPLEYWVMAEVSQSPCCDVCANAECRTIVVGGKVYETVPRELIIKAGLIAASELIAPNTSSSCCESKSSIATCCRK